MWTLLRVLLSTEHSCCVTMKMMSKKSNGLSLYYPNAVFFVTPRDSQGPRQPKKLFSHLPLPPFPPQGPKRQPMGGLAWTYSRREPTDQRIYSTVRQKTSSREASGPSLYLSVRLTDRPPYYHNCTPRDCSERLPFFGEPHLFFKWPYLSLKKMRHLGTMGAGLFSLFRFSLFFSFLVSVCIVVGLVVIKAPFSFIAEDTGHLSFSAFSWWSLYYVKGFCALKMLPLLCQCQT